MRPVRASLALALLSALAGQAAVAQQKPTLTPADYGKFENLGGYTLAPDGRWVAYGVSRVDERSELRVRPLDRDTTRTMAWGSAPRFSTDSRWLAWSIGVSPDEQRRLEREKKPLRQRAGLLELATGRERTFDAVRAQAFDATGRYLALHGYAPDEPRGRGADLRVLDLQSGAELTFGNVGEFAWSSAGSLLALTTSTGAAAGNGVQVYDARAGRLHALDGGEGAYRQLAWRSRAPELAVLRSVRPATRTGGRHVLLAWRALDGAAPRRLQLDSVAAGLSDTLMIAEHYRPRWSPDGRRLALGLQPVERDTARRDSTRRDSTRRDSARTGGAAAATRPDSARPAGAAADDLPTMQIWHTRDVQHMAQQKLQAQARARRTLLAVWEPAANRVVQVGTSVDENAQLVEGWRHALEWVDEPYPWGAQFGRRYYDVWATDLATGERRRLADSVRYAWASGAGRYLIDFDGTDYWTTDLRTGTRRNVTRGLGAAFADTASDTPTDLLPPHGVGGWLHGDRAVLLYDEHDVWRVAPDGSGATRLTRGAEERLTHRVVRVDTAGPTIDPAAPIYLALHGDWTEQRGWARLRPGASAPERLLLADAMVGGLQRADSAAVLAWRAERRDDSPDLFVAGPTLADARQVTSTNPFLGDYAWTRAELVAYANETGRELQGVLLYPADHDPSRRYPMIVYAYEILSPTMHQWQSPSERSYYNMTAWTQQGYFVLMPDIVFRARDPGVSLLETLRPAVRAVAQRGLVDSARVGFVGHSWGGYHAAYVATHSNLFATAVAGAAITDLVSFMGQMHWNSGGAEVDHFETGQARMEVPYWEDVAAHHRNSPIHNVHAMTTPLLMAHGDKDGTVEFFQATEFFNFARRAGRPMALLVYEGEDHGFRQKANQIDYHRRILEWFGHYLKGDPAPAWIREGVRMHELEREKRRVAGSPAGTSPRAANAAAGSGTGRP